MVRTDLPAWISGIGLPAARIVKADVLGAWLITRCDANRLHAFMLGAYEKRCHYSQPQIGYEEPLCWVVCKK